MARFQGRPPSYVLCNISQKIYPTVSQAAQHVHSHIPRRIAPRGSVKLGYRLILRAYCNTRQTLILIGLARGPWSRGVAAGSFLYDRSAAAHHEIGQHLQVMGSWRVLHCCGIGASPIG